MDQITDSEGQPLADLRKIIDYFYYYHIEITLNLPRTLAFLSQSSFGQRAQYRVRYNQLLWYVKTIFIESVDEIQNTLIFEYCKTGQVHAHACIKFNTDKKFSGPGLVSDLTKIYLNSLNKRYKDYQESCLTIKDSETTYIYFCPSIKLALHCGQPERQNTWDTYIAKNI